VALGIVNMLVKPILQVLTFPITIVTLGLWLFVINALMVMLVAAIVPGFDVAGFFSALIFSIILSIITGFLQKIGNSHSE
jgi:putative membrane protein